MKITCPITRQTYLNLSDNSLPISFSAQHPIFNEDVPFKDLSNSVSHWNNLSPNQKHLLFCALLLKNPLFSTRTPLLPRESIIEGYIKSVQSLTSWLMTQRFLRDRFPSFINNDPYMQHLPAWLNELYLSKQTFIEQKSQWEKQSQDAENTQKLDLRADKIKSRLGFDNLCIPKPLAIELLSASNLIIHADYKIYLDILTQDCNKLAYQKDLTTEFFSDLIGHLQDWDSNSKAKYLILPVLNEKQREYDSILYADTEMMDSLLGIKPRKIKTLEPEYDLILDEEEESKVYQIQKKEQEDLEIERQKATDDLRLRVADKLQKLGLKK